MTLWQKDKQPSSSTAETHKVVQQFTVGHDREMDRLMAAFDVQGSLAHIQMLESVGLLSATELSTLQAGLQEIHKKIIANDFELEEGVEDIHSQVELILTKTLGEAGKKFMLPAAVMIRYW